MGWADVVLLGLDGAPPLCRQRRPALVSSKTMVEEGGGVAGFARLPSSEEAAGNHMRHGPASSVVVLQESSMTY